MNTLIELRDQNPSTPVFQRLGTSSIVACVLVTALGISACNEKVSSTDPNSPETAQDDGALQSIAAGDGTNASGGSVVMSGTKVTIWLPRDNSRFPAGPDMPLADGTPCLTCHDTGDVQEFFADRSPNYELVKDVCTECHSADYSLYQPRLTKAGWTNVVKKMADRFDTTVVNGVPNVDAMLNPAHQALMTDYLTAINGK